MKRTLIFFIIVLFASNIYAQNTAEDIKTIRTQFKWVNSQTDFEKIELNNEEFLEHVPDNGGLLESLYKGKNLYKVTETIAISYAILTTEFYLWDNNLFFAYYTEKHYKEKKDSNGNLIELDYAHTDTKYEYRVYFKDAKIIREIEKGTSFQNKKDYLSEINNHQNLLDNKKKEKLFHGNWVSISDPLEVIECKENTFTTFYNSKYFETSTISIEGKYLYVTSADGINDRYEILNISNSNMKLLHLPRGNIIEYKKK